MSTENIWTTLATVTLGTEDGNASHTNKTHVGMPRLAICVHQIRSYETLNYVLATSSVAFAILQLLVIIVCCRQRGKCTYKQDLVYMVALAIVDLLFWLTCALGIVVPNGDNSLLYGQTHFFISCTSIILLAVRAVERLNILVRSRVVLWSLKFQIGVCSLTTFALSLPVSISNLLTTFRVIFLYWCICSLITFAAYAIIICILFKPVCKNNQANPEQTTEPQGELCLDIYRGKLSMPQDNSDPTQMTSLGEYIQLDTSSKLKEQPQPGTSKMMSKEINSDTIQMSPGQRTCRISKMTLKQLDQPGTSKHTLPLIENVVTLQLEESREAPTSNKDRHGINKVVIPMINVSYVESAQTEFCTRNTARNAELMTLTVPSPTRMKPSPKENIRTARCTLPEKTPSQTNPNTKTKAIPGRAAQEKMYIIQKRRLLKTSFSLALVTLFFYISWIPVWLLSYISWLPCGMLNLSYLNFIANPAIYISTIKSFRHDIAKILRDSFSRIRLRC